MFQDIWIVLNMLIKAVNSSLRKIIDMSGSKKDEMKTCSKFGWGVFEGMSAVFKSKCRHAATNSTHLN